MYHSLILLAGMFCLFRGFYLPSLGLLAGLIVACLILLAVKRQISKLIAIFLFGYCWAALSALHSVGQNLPLSLMKQSLVITGCLIEIKNYSPHYQRVLINIKQSYLNGELQPFKGKVSLGNYDPLNYTVTPGWCGVFTVVLKPVHGKLNSRGFDYEAWAYVKGIKATGAVKKASQLQAGQSLVNQCLRIRASLARKLENSLENEATKPLVMSLALGERNSMTDQQWQLLRRTGTSHLLAISGLHIGLVFWMVSIVTAVWWRIAPRACSLFPAQKAGWLSGLFFSAIYLLLTGLPLSGKRAWIMLFVVVILLQINEKTDFRQYFSLTLIVVLLIWPSSVLSLGFWFSFVAVGLIMLQLIHLDLKLVKQFNVFSSPLAQKVIKLLSIQMTLSVAMLPLSLTFFGELSLISPLANILAIPLVSFVALPCILVALILLCCGLIETSQVFLAAAQFGLEYLYLWLEKLVALDWSWVMPIIHQQISIILLMCGVFLWLYWHWWPGKCLLCLMLIPLILSPNSATQNSEFNLNVFDVGQGLAIWIKTANKNLLIDTGFGIENGFNYFTAVIYPILKANGVKKLDTVVISHNDVDHAGGFPALVRSDLNPKLIYSSKPDRGLQINFCKSGFAWIWDKVTFEFLTQDKVAGKNNRSCVLKVSSRHGSVLLPADIEQQSERSLLINYKNKLDSDVLIIPHHGSKTSSTTSFIQAVNPQMAIFSTGYLNRYRHPAKNVVKRYQQQHVELYNTACHGQITVAFTASGISAVTHRENRQPFWRHQCSDLVN